MEEDDIAPNPRNPPTRSFEGLPNTGIALEPEKYSASSRNAPRYDSYDYFEGKNLPPWKDEDLFYQWLNDSEIPRELAEMLYAYAPEVSFMLGPGHIWGVESIIEYNSHESEIHRAGFFGLASGSNGDFIAIRLGGPNAGEVGYLSHEEVWGMSPGQVQAMFIPVIRTIGDFFQTFESKQVKLPRDYYDAKDRLSS